MFSSQVFAEWTCIYMYVWLAVNRHIAQGKAFYHDFDWWNEGAFCCLLNRVATNLRCLPLHLSHCLSHSLSLIHSQWLIYIYLPNAILTHSHTYNAHRTSQHIMHSCMYCNCKRQQQKREIQKKKIIAFQCIFLANAVCAMNIVDLIYYILQLDSRKLGLDLMPRKG